MCSPLLTEFASNQSQSQFLHENCCHCSVTGSKCDGTQASVGPAEKSISSCTQVRDKSQGFEFIRPLMPSCLLPKVTQTHRQHDSLGASLLKG